MTTKQVLAENPASAHFIDWISEPYKWGADPTSTEDAPVIYVEVYTEIEVRFSGYQPD